MPSRRPRRSRPRRCRRRWKPPFAKFGPHKQANLPPLPFQAYAPPRPQEVVRAAYLFAAEHPEVLSYVPCFCGCERAGHRGNEDCFVAKRDASGDVTEWEPHGLDCTVSSTSRATPDRCTRRAPRSATSARRSKRSGPPRRRNRTLIRLRRLRLGNRNKSGFGIRDSGFGIRDWF